MGKSFIFGGTLLTTIIAVSSTLPHGAYAMSPAKTTAPQDAAPAPSIPLTSDGHHYRAIVFGGSCEEGQPTNDFHADFIRISTQLNVSGWDVRPLFAGDSAHCAGTAADPCPAGVNVSQWSSTTIAQAAGKDPSSVGRASKASLLASLDQAGADLSSGDELLVVIDTHGYGEKVADQTFWDHGICVSSDQPHGSVANFDPASGLMNSANKEGLMYMTDPDLQQRLQKLKNSGVKMAFLDDSCYGGGSVDELSAYGCVMSSSTSRQENFETGDIGSSEAQSSENGIAFNLPDLLMSDADTLATQSLHPHQITMEEFWLRILARSKIAGVPEFSGFMSDAQLSELLGDWTYGFEGDVTYRRGNTPFTTHPASTVYTAAPLVSYAQADLNSVTDSKTQQSDAVLLSSYWTSPGLPGTYDNVATKSVSALQSQITNLQGQWNNWVVQFNQLVAEEAPILADLSMLNMTVNWTFSGQLQGTEDLLNTVLSSINGQDVSAFPTSSSGNPWIVLETNLDSPDSEDFAGNLGIAADSIAYYMNAYKLSHDSYLSGLSDTYSDELGAMIVQAEKTAWNSASSATQARMRSDFQQLTQLRNQERVLLTEFSVDTVSYLSQARFYSYLGYRQQAALIDPKQSQCSDFVLKRY